METNKKIKSPTNIVEHKIAYHYNDEVSKYYIKLLNNDQEIQVTYEQWSKIQIGKHYDRE